MSSSVPRDAGSPEVDRTFAEIERLLDQVAALAESDLSAAEFLTELLSSAVAGVGSRSGAIWRGDHTSGGTPVTSLDGTQPSSNIQTLIGHPGHDRLLRRTLDARQPALVRPGVRETGTQQELNPTGRVLLLAPIACHDHPPDALLEVLLDEGDSPAANQAALDVLTAFTREARVFFERLRFAGMRQRIQQSDTWDRLTARLHRTLDPEAVAFTLANEGRELIGCDRIWVVAERRGGRNLVVASGQSVVDRRSPVTTAVVELAGVVERGCESVEFPDASAELPPEIETRAQAVCDLTRARRIVVWPLSRGTRPAGASDAAAHHSASPGVASPSESEVGRGVLVFEHSTASTPNPAFPPRYADLAEHARLALGNCLRHESLPLFPFVSWLARWTPRRLVGWKVTVPLLLCLLAALLGLIPAELTVTGQGTLQPEIRRDIFARTDGVVEEIAITHGAHCQSGDLLLTLSRSQLELEQTRVAGELQTALRRLASIEAARLQADPQSVADRDRVNQSAAEEEELRETVAGLERQVELLDQQAGELRVRAPLEGDVLTWDVEELLAFRPVQRGQRLLTLADLQGPWILEVDIPDESMGHVLEARVRSNDPLPVSFMLATEPGTTFRGLLDDIALSAEPDRTTGQRVRAVVRIPDADLALRRPGAVVIPRIHCGRYPIGYVWFHTAWENLQKYLLF